MKKMAVFLLSAALCCALTVPAWADVIWEPENDFYEAHADKCEYLGRSYYVNGPEGAAAVWQKPGGGYVAVLENGTALHVAFTYRDLGGTVWGVAEYGEGNATGWIDMADLLLIYDGQAFEEEHRADFLPYDGSFADLCHSEDRRVIVWTYPGSGEINCDFDTLSQSYSALEPDVIWTDGDGRVWGHVGYYMAARGWVCLSEPGNQDLPVAEREYNLYPAGDLSQVGRAPWYQSFGGVLPVSLGVALICGATAILLFQTRKKR